MELHKRKSRKLCFYLRHDPHCINLDMDSCGWVSINKLIDNTKSYANLNFTAPILSAIVASDLKGRYSINKSGTKIRANQGHSLGFVNPDLELVTIESELTLYHGTSSSSVNSIFKNGLNKQSRNLVHLSKGRETAETVAFRHSENIAIFELVFHCDDQVYVSKNGVYLCGDMPPEKIKKTIKNITYKSRG